MPSTSGSTIEEIAVDEEVGPDRNPQHFAISEFLWVMSVVAIVMVVLSPFLRTLSKPVLMFLGLVVGAQSLVIVSLIVWISLRRKWMLDKAGDFLGRGNAGEDKHSNWGKVSIAMMTLYFIGMQGFGATAVTSQLSGQSGKGQPGFLAFGFGMQAYFLFMSSFTLWNIVRYVRWRQYPETVEFFSNGMAQMDILTPWERLEVRRSQLHENRLAIVVTPERADSGKSTAMVWVDIKLAEQLIGKKFHQVNDDSELT